MKKKNIIILIISILFSFSLIGCNVKDDYIIQTKENTDEKPSGDKVNEAFETDKMKDIMDKLKSEPKEISDKINNVDSDTERIMKELNQKADELTDALNNADLDGKSEDIKEKMDDISDKLDELEDKVDDAKDRADAYENPIDKTKVTDAVDNFSSHVDNLERAMNRAASTR